MPQRRGRGRGRVDAGDRRQPPAQRPPSAPTRVPDRVKPAAERVVDRGAEAELAGDVASPSSRSGARRRGARSGRGAVQVAAWRSRKGGSSRSMQRAPDVEEAGAARAAQVLAAGGGEHVAADRVDVERQLADRLAGVEQVGDAGRAREAPDLGGRVDQAAVGRHVGDGDELDALVEQVARAPRRRAGRARRRHDLDDRAGAPRHLEEGDEVAGVLGPRR